MSETPDPYQTDAQAAAVRELCTVMDAVQIQNLAERLADVIKSEFGEIVIIIGECRIKFIRTTVSLNVQRK